MIPFVLAHVRLSTSGGSIEELERLRDAIKLVVEAHADQWGVRVKRRRISADKFAKLLQKYKERARAPLETRELGTITVTQTRATKEP